MLFGSRYYMSAFHATPSAGYKSQSFLNDAWRKFRRQRTAVFGLVLLCLISTCVIVIPFFQAANFNKLDLSEAYKAPSVEHPFGTNDLGQDQFARALIGGRASIAVGLLAMLVSTIIGINLGMVSGYFGGRIDNLLMRLTEVFQSLPALPVLLFVVYLFRDLARSAFGPELGPYILVILTIGSLQWMIVARLVRSSFLSLRTREFVEAARCIGVPDGRIIFYYLLPNSLSPIIVAATIGIGSAIIIESTISFLGLGLPPDFPTWGRMLFESID